MRLPSILVLLLLPVLSGCLALGLGAAAVVGGCALLDENEDDRITEEEFSEGLFDAWDNGDGRLTHAEFDAGIRTSRVYASWSGSFNAWDASGNGTLSRGEFTAGAVGSGDISGKLDDDCDGLGL